MISPEETRVHNPPKSNPPQVFHSWYSLTVVWFVSLHVILFCLSFLLTNVHQQLWTGPLLQFFYNKSNSGSGSRVLASYCFKYLFKQVKTESPSRKFQFAHLQSNGWLFALKHRGAETTSIHENHQDASLIYLSVILRFTSIHPSIAACCTDVMKD